jgi:hypothetical protein
MDTRCNLRGQKRHKIPIKKIPARDPRITVRSELEPCIDTARLLVSNVAGT